MQNNLTPIEDKKLMLIRIKKRYRYIVLHGRMQTLVRRCKMLDTWNNHIIKNY